MDKPMTYRQIKEYADDQGWDFSGFEADLVKRGVRPAPSGDGPIPFQVDYWLNDEVQSVVRESGRYDWPANLDAIQRQFVVGEGDDGSIYEILQRYQGPPR